MIVFSCTLIIIMLFVSIYFSFRDKNHFVPYFIIPIFIFFISEPLLYARYIDGIDTPDFLCILNGMHYNFTSQFQIPYRINDTILYGTQQPIFYHLTPCYLFVLFRLFHISEIVALNIMLLVFQILTALFMYITSYRIFKDKYVAIGSSLLLLCNQYRVSLLYGPFRLGETIAFMLVPLFILSVYEMLYGDNKKIWLFVISASLLYQSHMLSTYLYFILTLVVFIIWAIKEKNISRIKSFLFSSVLIVLINLWYLIPQIYEFLYVDFINPAFYNGNENYFVTNNLQTHSSSDVFIIVALIFILMIIAFVIIKIFINSKYLIIKSKLDKYNHLKIAIIILFIGTIYHLCAYNTIPIESIKYTALAKLVQVLQFSERFFIVSIPFIALSLPYIIKIILDFIINKLKHTFFVKIKNYLYLFLIIFISFPGIVFMNNYLKSNNLVPLVLPQYSLDYFLNGIGTSDHFEYNDNIILSSDDIQIDMKNNGELGNRANIAFDYYVEDYKDKSILLPLYSYPVYKVVDENGDKVETKDGYNRLIEIELKKSKGSFYVSQYEPPVWLMGDIISLFTFLGIVIFYINKCFRRKDNAKNFA